MKYCVQTNKLISTSIRYLTLTPEKEKLQFRAGQYLEFVVSEKELAPFSIANAPRVTGELEIIIRENAHDPLLQNLLRQLNINKEITLVGPFGNCVYQSSDKNTVILLAGGVGIGQIKSILEKAISENDARDFHLYWGISAREDFCLEYLIKEWQLALSHFHPHVVLTSEETLIANIVHDFPSLSECEVYSSGPWKLTDDALLEFTKHGLTQKQMHSDRFAFL